ncbi:hypothetical protein JTB14_031819 [Gonioctena quinquepunctata]|nr:hypothetical protein JTB14_031819 [Gonioctena quinquepunctata]
MNSFIIFEIETDSKLISVHDKQKMFVWWITLLLALFQTSVQDQNREENCTCVNYYLCKNGTIDKSGEGLIDIRSRGNPTHGQEHREKGSGSQYDRMNDVPCEKYLQVCCNHGDNRTEPVPQPPVPVKPTTGCGNRNPEGVGFKITGGKDNKALYGEFPWMVAILREESLKGKPLDIYQCGGSLIHPQAVVTAAHCVSGKNTSFKVRAGEWDTKNSQEIFPHQDRDVLSITIHPQYHAGALYNDIAVLILKSPVQMEQHIGFVCLPSQEDIIQSGRCFATGWGKDVFGNKGKYQMILKKINLPIVTNPQCQEKLRTTRLEKFFELHRSFICAGGEPNEDTCDGDGGSPLVCPIAGSPDRYFQAGIVAWGIGCGKDQIPGVYVNVAMFRNWIDEQMKIHGLTFPSS